MPASITITPLDPDRVGEWRAFHRELSGVRRADWARSQRRRGIRREAVWLVETPHGPQAVVLVEGSDPDAARRDLASSDDAFDVWFRRRLSSLLGEPAVGEAVFDSRPRPGSWRGWTRRDRR